MSPRLARCEWQPEMFFRPLGRTEKQLPVGFFRETAHSALILALFLSFGALLKWRLQFFLYFLIPSPTITQPHLLLSTFWVPSPSPPLQTSFKYRPSSPLLFSPLLTSPRRRGCPCRRKHGRIREAVPCETCRPFGGRSATATPPYRGACRTWKKIRL